MWKYILLKASTLEEEATRRQKFYLHFLIMKHIIMRFLFQKTKWGKPQITTELILLNINIWLFLIASASMYKLSNRDFRGLLKCAAFLVIILKFKKLCLLVTPCNNFLQNDSKRVREVILPHVAIKTASEILDRIQIFTVCSLQNRQEKRKIWLIGAVMVTWLLWQVWIFSNPLGKY